MDYRFPVYKSKAFWIDLVGAGAVFAAMPFMYGNPLLAGLAFGGLACLFSLTREIP